jgi:hypothetical protein
MDIQWGEGEMSRCGGALRGGAEDESTRPGAGKSAKRWLISSVEKREEEIGWATRRTGAEREGTREVFVLWSAVSCGSRERCRG